MTRQLIAWIACTIIMVGTGDAKAAFPVDAPIELETQSGVIFGSLLVPSRLPAPVVILIAGSGPTDRNGNSTGGGRPNNGLLRLAEELQRNGIASVRYDKRGVGASVLAASRESDLRFDDYVVDASQWIGLLRHDYRFTTVTVLGHSEGSLIAMLAAQRVPADALISLSGPSLPAGSLLRKQLHRVLTGELLRRSDQILDELSAGRTTDAPNELSALFRLSVQPYLISWMRYEPTAEIARLKMPVLIIGGSADVQVGVTNASELGAASPGSQVEIIEGMDHLLKSTKAGAGVDEEVPLAIGLGHVIVEFISTVCKRPANPS